MSETGGSRSSVFIVNDHSLGYNYQLNKFHCQLIFYLAVYNAFREYLSKAQSYEIEIC